MWHFAVDDEYFGGFIIVQLTQHNDSKEIMRTRDKGIDSHLPPLPSHVNCHHKASVKRPSPGQHKERQCAFIVILMPQQALSRV